MPDQPSYPETLQACHARIAELEERLAGYQNNPALRAMPTSSTLAFSQDSTATRPQPNASSEQHLQLLLQHLPIIVYTLDSRGVFTSSQGSGLASIGLQPGQVVGASAYALYADNPEILSYVQRALAGESLRAESYLPALDIYFENYYAPLYGSQGQLQGVMGVSYDISERKRSQRRLEQAQQLAQLAEFTYDVAAQSSSASPGLFALYGLEPADSITIESIRPLMTLEDFAALEHSFLTTLQTGEKQATEYRITTPAGQARDIYSVWEAVYTPQGQISHVFGMVQDISERKRAERELYDKQQMLEAAQNTLQQANAQLSLHNRVSEALQTADSLEDILSAVLEPLGEHASASLFYSLNNAQGQPEHVMLKAHRGADFPIPLGSVFSLEQFSSAALWLARPDEPLVLADAINDPRLNEATRSAHAQFHPLALVAVPLRQGTTWVGMLQLSWPTARNFSASQQTYFEALPAMLAPVLANYRLLESLEQTIAERTAALQSQLAENAHFKALLEATSDIISYASLQGEVLYLNPAGHAFFGAGNSNNMSIAQAHPPASLQRLHEEGIPTVMSKGIWRGEMALLNAQGEAVPVSQVITLIKDQQGTAIALGTIIRDIRDDKRLQADLSESRRLLRATIDNASSVIFVKDIQGCYILANKRLEDFLGRPMQSIIGSNDYDLLPQAVAEEVRRNDAQVMANAQAVTIEERIPTDEGARVFLATKFPLLDDDGQVFALGCITTDISEQKIAEAKVQAYRDQLAKAQTEVQITQRIQELLLPDIRELQAIHELDIAGYMKPAEHIGGDYYDILRIGDSVKIGIGDVTGHGLESGLLMLMTQTAVRTLLSSNERDPRRMMSILNRTVFDNLQRMHVDKSLTLSLFDYCQGVLRVSGQHEYVVMMRQGGEIEVVDTIDLGVPLGLEADISRFINEQVLPLQPGEGAILFTDGITEAENIAGEQFGLPRLVALAKEHWQSPAAQISQAIVHSVEQHIAGHTVYDDITLVVLKRPQPEDIAIAAHA